MIRYDKHRYKNDIVKTQVRVVEGYRDKEGKMKQRTIKNFGYLESASNQEEFIKQVKAFDEEFKKRKKKVPHSINVKFNEDSNSIPYNYGYKYLEAIYDSLELDEVFNKQSYKCQYDLNGILKFFAIQRLLNPDSKRATTRDIETLYNMECGFQLHDVYRSLERYNQLKIEIQSQINKWIKEMIGRDSSYAYYDVTNYYNEIDYPKSEEDLRQRGVSKEHRVDPIIQLGLFMDSNGIPISMSIFKGNTSDSKTLQPVMEEIKKNYNLNRLIVVADKGLNSSSNINYIVNNNDGYVVSQILRGKKGKRYQERLFDDSKYKYNKDRSFKYQEFIEEYEVINKEGKKETKERKVLIYWKLEDAILNIKKRDDKIARAIKSLGNNVYKIKHAYDEYIKEIHMIEKTGEIADTTEKEIDKEKIENDALYDGYFCIITSETEYDYKKIMEVYGGLWRIEETFRITKSDLEVRPIYVSTESHINGHFIMCYVSLVMIRLLQYKLKYKLSVERIVEALNTAKCIHLENGDIRILRNETKKEYQENQLIFNNDDQIVKDYIEIIKAFDKEIPYSIYSKKEFEKYLGNITYKK